MVLRLSSPVTSHPLLVPLSSLLYSFSVADPVWRVRAAVCERLDKIGRFLVASASTPAEEVDALLRRRRRREGERDRAGGEEEGGGEGEPCLPSASLGAGTCLVSVLVQFLKDREVSGKPPPRHTYLFFSSRQGAYGVADQYLYG